MTEENNDLWESRNLEAKNQNNSTCYWKTDSITDKNSSLTPFFLYFLIVFLVINAFKILLDYR